MPGPLDGLNVVEIAGLGPAPLAGQLLADMGAEVIVIDRASARQDSSDINRRGKRSIALNLKSAAGIAVARDLIARADILIEGFRPGVMERLGLGPDDLPDKLIYGRMTGWGQDGPLAQTAGHDLTYLAQTGVLSLMGTADAPPKPPLNLVADYGGGSMFLVFGILSAVIARGRTGKGQVVDAAMIDGVPAMMGLLHGFMANGFWSDRPGTNWLDGGAPFYRCYRCADGRDIAVAALEPQFYAALLKGLDLDAASLPDQNDRTQWGALTKVFAELFASRPRDAWVGIFAGTDACVAPVLSMTEAARDPHLAARSTYVAVDGVVQAAPAPRFSRSVPRVPAEPGAPGADGHAILSELGYDAARIDDLQREGHLT
ncbi:CaiB/BaiF CoA-transferase family protein [Tateyamaria sp. ANG-S1]|uniref:CaiB/BaiF CoA transferase family protein n=1 Tax=Tateyamaria sp. ANG-S1 TaxID=1577905 RepID=UPI00057EECA6|nr:CaiB/BaiF CoA-transferase family protein [Tateyamaria sp. ANG-S1]KIC51335.1 carnitine dehydratase [Tateyamaria sp. ANG-S1]